ncbi:hypothetical protein EYF80_006048 [Liparis tanakae]|uniref:Uncharacterized protein n=1 Tax=Liparis tanakae TaxID=230148 RepID=A0A4Z2IZT0_9TELE|nr:hypothetical protein EYF80_006048 [Liparis tanakae]
MSEKEGIRFGASFSEFLFGKTLSTFWASADTSSFLKKKHTHTKRQLILPSATLRKTIIHDLEKKGKQ